MPLSGRVSFSISHRLFNVMCRVRAEKEAAERGTGNIEIPKALSGGRGRGDEEELLLLLCAAAAGAAPVKRKRRKEEQIRARYVCHKYPRICITSG